MTSCCGNALEDEVRNGCIPDKLEVVLKEAVRTECTREKFDVVPFDNRMR